MHRAQSYFGHDEQVLNNAVPIVNEVYLQVL